MSPCWLDVCGRHLRAVLARAGVSTFWRCLTSILEFSASKKYSKEDYKPCKWGATARYYASLTKTMLPKRKSVPWSSRQSDHTKTSWPSKRDVNCSGMVMSNVHQVWPKLSCKAQWKGKEDKADRGRGRKTTSGNGQAWSLASPRGQWRTRKKGGNWLQNHLWCPNDPRGKGIDEMRWVPKLNATCQWSPMITMPPLFFFFFFFFFNV